MGCKWRLSGSTLVSFRVIGGFQPWMRATITWRPLITDDLDPTPRDPCLICLPCGPGMEFLKAPQVILKRNQGIRPLNDVIHEAGPGGKVATLRYKLRFIWFHSPYFKYMSLLMNHLGILGTGRFWFRGDKPYCFWVQNPWVSCFSVQPWALPECWFTSSESEQQVLNC